MERNCPECKEKTNFVVTEKKKQYECSSCHNVFHQCKNRTCMNMIKHGPICSDCVGRSLQKYQAGLVAAAGGVVAITVKNAPKIIKALSKK